MVNFRRALTADNQTVDFLPSAKRKGRPTKEGALTNAQRQQLFRERKKAKFLDDADAFTTWTNQQLQDCMIGQTKLAVQCWLEYGRRRGWVAVDMHVMR